MKWVNLELTEEQNKKLMAYCPAVLAGAKQVSRRVQYVLDLHVFKPNRRKRAKLDVRA